METIHMQTVLARVTVVGKAHHVTLRVPRDGQAVGVLKQSSALKAARVLVKMEALLRDWNTITLVHAIALLDSVDTSASTIFQI